MSQNPDFKDTILLVNLALTTDSPIDASTAGTDGNMFIRNNYSSTDVFRSLLKNQYWRLPQGSPPALINTATNTSYRGADGPLIVTSISNNKYYIELNNERWNEASRPNGNPDTEDLLRQNIDIDGVYEGDPNWRFYLEGGSVGEGTSIPVDSLLSQNTPVFANSGPFKDHTNTYLKPANDPRIREASGMTIKVESKYNFYADTTPPYENILADVSEPMITNYYCLQSELRNTGSTVNSQDYFQQITLGTVLQHVNVDNDDEVDPWFVNIEVGGGMSESTTSEFYSLYSKGVSILKDDPAAVESGGSYGDTVDLTGIKSTFDTTYKNYVILCSDLEGLNKLVVSDPAPAGLTNLPFYNTITIGSDDHAVEDPSNTGNFFRKLSSKLGGSENFSPFMDMLQLYIIDKITNSSVEDSDTYANLTTTKIYDIYFHLAATSVTLDDNYETGHHFNWERFMYDTSHESLVTRINGNVSSNDSDNYILLRNYNTEDGVADADTLYIEKVKGLDTAGNIDYPIRNFDEVMAGESCYSEPVLYKIDKYNSSDTLVQTFFISARESDWDQKQITYIDSQVKYGEKYRYDIKQIRLVFGNNYSYENLSIFYTDTAPSSGWGIANALGFYRNTTNDIALDDVVSTGVQEYTTTATDPDYAASQVGHFIFQDSSLGTGANQHQYNTLFATGTGWADAPPIGQSMNNATDAEQILDHITVRVYPGGAEGGSLQVIPESILAHAVVLEDPNLVQQAVAAAQQTIAQGKGLSPAQQAATAAQQTIAQGKGTAQSQSPGSGIPAAGSAAQMTAPTAQSQPSSTPTVNTQTQVGTQTTSTYSIPSTTPKVGSTATIGQVISSNLPVLPIGWGYSSK